MKGEARRRGSRSRKRLYGCGVECAVPFFEFVIEW